MRSRFEAAIAPRSSYERATTSPIWELATADERSGRGAQPGAYQVTPAVPACGPPVGQPSYTASTLRNPLSGPAIR